MPPNYGGRSSSSGGACGSCSGCRCSCNCRSTTASFITLFLSLSLSFVLLILAGTAPGGSWVPMINLIAVIFLPMFILVSDSFGSAPTVLHDYSEPKRAWANFGFCFLGTVLASMLGLPLILLHAGIIKNTDFAYWAASIFVAIIGGGISVCLKPGRERR